MKVYIVLAHPERLSFNAVLADVYRSTFEADGHQVRFRDLHADGFNPLLTRADFRDDESDDLVQFPGAQSRAWSADTTAADIAYTVRVSSDLANWQDAAQAFQDKQESIVDGSYRGVFSVGDAGAIKTRYVQVQIRLNP